MSLPSRNTALHRSVTSQGMPEDERLIGPRAWSSSGSRRGGGLGSRSTLNARHCGLNTLDASIETRTNSGNLERGEAKPASACW
jgi:hypothetical protein